ncbi:SAM-dependent methyltransferase [Georgenia sp. SUBG003]|uniref:SAM-dependent methyltransferase n=1 Tax=Georgenia sp. SUBG003 TaxID=1497974 RepID=UPI0004D6809D|nr:SAM-dependent methyltransferase [Georgenia sp. SUBG003]
MTHEFDKAYWEHHWEKGHGEYADADADRPGKGPGTANPYLARELGDLSPGTALDAGCGEGAESMWLAGRGWKVTGADISAAALARAAERAKDAGLSDHVRWVEADLTVWTPSDQFDLVTTSYAHPAMPQLTFYDRIAGWVAAGGTLLLVGHLHDAARTHETAPAHEAASPHTAHHPVEATVTLADVTAGLDPAAWQIETAEEVTRVPAGHGGHAVPLRDVVVRATRRA